MKEFNKDRCPKCGEEHELEYGHVYAECGEAWHMVTCLKCGTYYNARYTFASIDDVNYGEEE